MAIPQHTATLATPALLLCCAAALGQLADEPLHRRQPTDLVVMDASSDSAELELAPDTNRFVPKPLPQAGALRARLVENPSVEVEIPYAKIVRYEAFPDRLMRHARQHVDAQEFGQAYDYLARLDRDYPDQPGLQELFARSLRGEVAARHRAGEQDHALALLQALVERAPRTPGLDRVVDTIGDAILTERWERGDYAGVSNALALIERQFASVRPKVAKAWRQKIADSARDIQARGEALAAQGRTREALKVVSGAAALDLESGAVRRLLQRLSASDKTLWVGVFNAAAPGALADLDTPTARRQARLLGGSLATLDEYAPSGGRYDAAAGGLRVEDGSRRLAIELRRPTDPALLSRLLLDGGESASEPLALLRSQASRVAIEGGALEVSLRRAHPQPAAMLTGSLPGEAARLAPGDWRRVPVIRGSGAVARYERVRGSGDFDAIEEYAYDDVNEAVQALQTNQLHVIAELPILFVDGFEESPVVAVGQYRLPRVHCLLMSDDTALRERRELRRAVCYAIARQEIVDSLMLGGRERSGFEVLSAPLPVGRSLSDSLRYAYNDSVAPRPYEPRLAALLLTAARATDKSRAEAAAKAAAEGGPPVEPQEPVPETIRLAHAPAPAVRAACQAIKQQLEAVGFRIELVEADEATLTSGGLAYDLRYAEVTMGEPLADVWRLLGPGGLAGECSPPLLAALEDVLAATNGKEAAERLRDLHRVISADLPVIPLWQTVEHYAYLKQLGGVPYETVDLYQSIDKWRIAGGEAR